MCARRGGGGGGVLFVGPAWCGAAGRGGAARRGLKGHEVAGTNVKWRVAWPPLRGGSRRRGGSGRGARRRAVGGGGGGVLFVLASAFFPPPPASLPLSCWFLCLLIVLRPNCLGLVSRLRVRCVGSEHPLGPGIAHLGP